MRSINAAIAFTVLLVASQVGVGICSTLELIISDSGRNQAWSSRLRIGDDFNAKGADGNPVGGVMAGTTPIQQLLVPMPSKTELQQMSPAQEKVWTQQLSNVLKDRVHIATTNGVSLFEVRLLQDTPQPANPDLPWQANPLMDRFSRMTYRAVGGLVQDLRERQTPVRVTAAMADSGCQVFSKAIEEWKPYADNFRRVDMVDGRSSLGETRPVISTLGSKRVRLFNTEGSTPSPMSIGQTSAAKGLLKNNPGLMLYTVRPEQTDTNTVIDSMPWETSLAGFEPYSLTRFKYSQNQITEQNLGNKYVAQDFRGPVSGWDPQVNIFLLSRNVSSLGISLPKSYGNSIPNMHRSLATGCDLTHEVKHGETSNAPAFFALKESTIDTAQLNAQMNLLADSAADFKNVLVVGSSGSRLTNRLADTISRRVGDHRVRIVDDLGGNRKVSGLAKDYNASCVVGFRDNFETTHKNASYLISRDAANVIVKGATALKSSLEAMQAYHSPELGGQWTFSQMKKANEYSERLGKNKFLSPTLTTVKRASGLLESLNKDFSRADQGQFRWITSHTVEKVGEIGVDVITDTGFLKKTIGERSALYKPLGAFGSAGGVDAVRAVAQISGSGNWHPRKWDIKTWELVTTSFSDASAYGLGVAVAYSTANPAAAHEIGSAFQSGAALARAGLIPATQPLFDSMMGAVDGEAITAIAQYENAASRAVLSGASVPKVDDWFTKDQRKALGINRGAYKRLLGTQDTYEQMSINQRIRHSYSYSKNSQNLNTRTIEIPESRMDMIAPRIGHGTNLVLRGRTVLDKYNLNKLNANSVNISRDPFNLKTPKTNDVVINSTPAYESMSSRLGTMETNKTLLDFTRNDTSKPSFLEQGFKEIENMKFGDMTDFSRYRTSSYPTSRDLHFRPEVDGVMLNASAMVEGDGSALTSGNVSLIFQNSSGVIDFMKLKRFATALWCTYLSVEGPGISIEPVNTGLQARPDKHEVRYIGQVRNTELSMVMRETDYLMKRWSVGSHCPDISNFLTPDEIRTAAGKKPSYRPSRFWLIPEELTFKQSDNMMLLSSGRMTVQTEYLDNNPTGEKNEINELFAKWMTDNYAEISYRYPVFDQLFEYSKLVSLSTYLRENQIPMLWFLMANRELIITEKSIDEVDQLSKKSGNEFWVTAYGGVEMQLDKIIQNKNSYQYDASLAAAETSIRTDLSDSENKNKPVVFSANDTSYTVASENTLKLFSTPADGDTIQTDLGLVDKYNEKNNGSDVEEWKLVAPRLELVRYYNPEITTNAQFGRGWHLLVPFRLETETKVPLADVQYAPKKLVMANLLSGIQEVLCRDRSTSNPLRYVPEEKSGLTESLVRHPNGAWKLNDRLGSVFTFDRDGDLTQMVLRKDQKISFKIGEKSYSKFITGYSVEYRYSKEEIHGNNLKFLTAVKQGEHSARIYWNSDSLNPQIAIIRVLQQGQIKPIEVLNYEYGLDGILSRVKSKSGRSVNFTYENDHMRVSLTQ